MILELITIIIALAILSMVTLLKVESDISKQSNRDLIDNIKKMEDEQNT